MPLLIDDHLEKLGLLSTSYISKISYTDKPNSQLCLTRLLNQEKEFYQITDNQEIKNYKILVLNAIITQSEFHAVCVFIEEWTKFKRKLFIRYQNNMIEITSVEIFRTYLPFLDNPTAPNVIFSELAQHNIAADQIAIIDTFKLKEILSMSSIVKTIAQTRQLQNLAETRVIHIDSLLASQTTLTQLSHSLLTPEGDIDFSESTLKDEQLIILMTECVNLSSYTSIKLDSRTLSLLLAELPRSKHLKLQSITLLNVKTIELPLIALFKLCPLVTKLELINCNLSCSSEINYSLLQNALSQITSLTLIRTNRYPSGLFSKAPLQELVYLRSEPSEEFPESHQEYVLSPQEVEARCARFNTFINAQFQWEHLTRLTWHDNFFSESLLMKTPRLLDLEVEAKYFHAPSESAEKPKLADLKNFWGIFTLYANLNDLLLSMPSLEIADLKVRSASKNFLIQPNSRPGTLSKSIHTLRLDLDSTDEEVHLATLFLITQLIENNRHSLVDFVFSDHEGILPVIASRDFPALKRFSLSILPNDSPHYSQYLALMMTHASNLELLNLEGNTQYTQGTIEPHILDAIKLTKLTSLSFNSIPSYGLAIALLFNSPALKEVCFNPSPSADTFKKYLLKTKTKLPPFVSFSYFPDGYNAPDNDDIKILTQQLSPENFTQPLSCGAILEKTSQGISLKMLGSLNKEKAIPLRLSSAAETKATTLIIEGAYWCSSKSYNFQTLTQLKISNTTFNSFNILIKLLNSMPKLQYVDFSDINFEERTNHLDELQELSCLESIITDNPALLYCLAPKCPKVQRLQLNTNQFISAQNLALLRTHLPSLKSIYLPIPIQDLSSSLIKNVLKQQFQGVQQKLFPMKVNPNQAPLSNDQQSAATLEHTEGPSIWFPIENFKPKPANPTTTESYRLDVYSQPGQIINGHLTYSPDAFHDVVYLNETKRKQLIAPHQLSESYNQLPFMQGYDTHYGCILSEHLKEKRYYRLPSLSPHDELLGIKITTVDAGVQKDITHLVHIGYSKQRSQYVIQGVRDINQECMVEFMINKNTMEFKPLWVVNAEQLAVCEKLGNALLKSLYFSPSANNPIGLRIDADKASLLMHDYLRHTIRSYGPAIGHIRHFFQGGGLTPYNTMVYYHFIAAIYLQLSHFGKGELSEHDETPQGLLSALIRDRKGACRHRSYLFKAIWDALNLPARLIMNECHAFIELLPEVNATIWFTLDLGGYPGQVINISIFDDMNNARSAVKKRKARLDAQPAVVDGNTRYIEPPPQQQKKARVDSANLPAEQSDDEHEAEDKVIQPSPYFITWEPTRQAQKTFVAFWLQLQAEIQQLTPGTQNVLITLPNQNVLNQFRVAVMQAQAHHKKALFNITSLDDITLLENCVIDEEHRVEPSELVCFLRKPTQAGDVLMIDWTQSKPKHIGYNTITDSHERRLNKHPLSPDLSVLILITQDQVPQLREDFYSRFSLKKQIPLNMELPQAEPSAVVAQHVKSYPIDFMGNMNWKALLIGSIGLKGNQIVAKEGQLQQALREECTHIELINLPSALLNDVKVFLSGIQHQGSFYFNRQIIPLPAALSFSFKETPCTWEGNYFIAQATPQALGQIAIDGVLNHETYSSFFERYRYHDNASPDEIIYGKISAHPSRISAEHQGQRLNLLVTTALSQWEWARLIKHATTHQMHLNFLSCELTYFPQTMIQHAQQARCYTVINEQPAAGSASQVDSATQPQVSYFICEEMDYLIEGLNNQAQAQQITVTPSMGYEIVEKIDLHNTQASGPLAVTYQLGVLSRALMGGKSIILKIAKGMLTPQLEAALESLFLRQPYLMINGDKQPINGKLTIVSEVSTYFKCFPNKVEVPVSLNDILARLETHENKALITQIKGLLQQVSFNLNYLQIKTLLRRNNPLDLNAILPFVLGETNYDAIQKELIGLFRTTPMDCSEDSPACAEAQDEFQIKSKAIIDWLAINPCIFLIGPTGSGKSSLVQKSIPAYLKNTRSITPKIYMGMDKLAEWANAPESSHPILFIDEANLLPLNTLELFADMYNATPGIMVGNKYITLSRTHRVIFAGNTANYAGRVQHKIAATFGMYYELPAMSEPTLLHRFIIPHLKADRDAIEINRASKVILNAYQYVISQLSFILTPRNLENICIRFNQMHQSTINFKAKIELIAWLACYDEIRYKVDTSLKQQFRTLMLQAVNENEYKQLKHALVSHAAQLTFQDYALTHKKQRRMIYDFLKSEASHSGLLLEGMPGLGKSTVIQKYLEKLQKPYITLHACTQDEGIKLLEHAFHEGLIVIIDELNTMSYLEYVLNILMMGEDLEGTPAKKPGFRVIATQNPITFGGRFALSPALMNRFLKINLKELELEDLTAIARLKGISDEQARVMAKAYWETCYYAKTLQLKPEPTPRDYIRGLSLFALKSRAESKEGSASELQSEP